MNADEIVKVLEAAAAAGVSRLEMEGLTADFGRAVMLADLQPRRRPAAPGVTVTEFIRGAREELTGEDPADSVQESRSSPEQLGADDADETPAPDDDAGQQADELDLAHID